MATVTLLSDAELSPEALAIFGEIRAARNSDYVNDFWRALAHDPSLLRATWDRLRTVMSPDGALDPLTKELLYVAVSIVNGCEYCIHSHTAAARAKGMTPEQHGELLAVVAMASQTNALATALGVKPDVMFQADDKP
ncbi:MAG: carboxymuconolactone decarboxylase family protein [Rhodobacteraceae bacterium]|nr:carboxymuconolactone decarboxylase family protein [Paracoccaceae bacterium]